jgi:hypothetical protein
VDGRTLSSPSRVAAVLLPLAAVALVVFTHGWQLWWGIADSFKWSYDAHLIVHNVDDRYRAFAGAHDWLDADWFFPYPRPIVFMEPLFVEGVVYGAMRLLGLPAAAAFNACVGLLMLLNEASAYLLLRNLGSRRTVATLLAMLAAFSPFVWARYYSPFNTIFFPAVLALVLILRATRRPAWLPCIAAPVLLAVQTWTGLYVTMFAVLCGLALAPQLVARAGQSGALSQAALRLSVGAVLAAAMVWPVAKTYREGLAELHPGASYEYVSHYQPKSWGDHFSAASVPCRFGLVGSRQDVAACREEMFLGWPLLSVGLLGVAFFLFAFARRRAGRSLEPADSSEAVESSLPEPAKRRSRTARVAGMLIIGAGAALAAKATWPFHLACLAVLPLRPGHDGSRTRYVVDSVWLMYLAFLIFDVSMNPKVNLPGTSLRSVHSIFYHVPGMSGIRSEYRVVVFLPLVVAAFVAVQLREAESSLKGAGRRRSLRLAAYVVAGLVVLLYSQPPWQRFFEIVPFRESAVLEAAGALPNDAVLSVLAGEGGAIRWPTDADRARLDSYIMVHRHRTLSGFTNYTVPGASTLLAAAALPDPEARVLSAARVSRLFGASHLLIHWLDADAPSGWGLSPALGRAVRVVASDKRFALLEVLPMADVAFGPARESFVPEEAARIYARLSASFGLVEAGTNAPCQTEVVCSAGPQREGDALVLSFTRDVTAETLVIQPGLNTEGLPQGFVVEALVGGRWQPVASRDRWAISWDQIEHPRTGVLGVKLEAVRSEGVRVRLTTGSPFRWQLADVWVEGRMAVDAAGAR